jgi:hypothetical protein
MATKNTTTKKAPTPSAKKTIKARPAGDKSAKKLSQIDAAIRVLAEGEGADELRGDGRCDAD